jgi:type VI secretion system secreted protein Hcp
MAGDVFMKIDGIDGESTDKKYAKWFELHSFSHGVSQPSSGEPSTGGARSAERCDHQDFTIQKDVDKASPKFFEYCCKGNHIKEITVVLCRMVGNVKQEYMKYVLKDSIVSSYQHSGSGGLPTDSLSFNYGAIEWTYTELDHRTGQSKGEVAAGWDLVENKATLG